MTKFRQISLAAFTCAAMLVGAQTAFAAGSFSYPGGQVNYTFTSPQLSVYAAVEIGQSPTTSVSQTSVRNVAFVSQVGTKATTTVTQTGSMNQAHVVQIGTVTRVLTIQFGNFPTIIGP